MNVVRVICAGILFFFIQLPLYSSEYVDDSIQTGNSMFQVGEELEYSVHYSFFNIGTIRFKVTNKEERNGRIVYQAQAFMDSNPSLSWLVDLHVRFYSDIDQDAFSHAWISEDSTSKNISYRKMVFDYMNRKMYYESGVRLPSGDRKANWKDSIAIAAGCQDGLSLFFYARAHAQERRNTQIATFIDTNEVTANINFGKEYLSEEIDAVKYPINVSKLDGQANFVGVFGLTGGFEGVFSRDIASIPITARMKVVLGSISVELRKWKRGGWMPPGEEAQK